MLTPLFRNALTVLTTVLFGLFAVPAAFAESRAELERSSQQALHSLTSSNAVAKDLSAKATAILVFPKVTKAGLMVGGQYGEGVLWRDGKAVALYNTAGASFGFQAGAQQFGYAMFFMNQEALKSLDKADGFEIGVGPSVVVVDQGMAANHTTTTMQKDIYAFIFGQKGLMAGVGIQGNKITRLKQ